MHYHAWLRSGRVFTMAPRRFNDRTVAHKWAVKRRPDSADRFVLGCSGCPESRPSRRRPPRWSVVARAVAEAVGAPAAQVRVALNRVLQRPPTGGEVTRGLELMESLRQDHRTGQDKALELFCLVALNLNEFIYLD